MGVKQAWNPQSNPNWSLEFSPQHQTFYSTVVAHVCQKVAEIAVMSASMPMTFIGSTVFVGPAPI